MIEPQKICTTCRETKPFSEFYAYSYNTCKVCKRAYQKANTAMGQSALLNSLTCMRSEQYEIIRSDEVRAIAFASHGIDPSPAIELMMAATHKYLAL